MNIYIVEYSSAYTSSGYLVVQAFDEMSAVEFSTEYVTEVDFHILGIDTIDGSAGVIFSCDRP